jgi:hypothetical protein
MASLPERGPTSAPAAGGEDGGVGEEG